MDKTNSHVALTPVEEVIGYSFQEVNLGELALSTWRQGFSRLEFLGDSILGLAVFSTAEVNHFNRKEAAARVGMDDPFHFSRCFRAVHGVPPSALMAARR